MFKSFAIAIALVATAAVLPSHARSFNGPITWSSLDGGNSGVYETQRGDSLRRAPAMNGHVSARAPRGTWADGLSASELRAYSNLSTTF